MVRSARRTGFGRAWSVAYCVLPVSVLLTVLSGCESTEMIEPPVDAEVRVRGQVMDPSGAGVEDASVTVTLHETRDCASPALTSSTIDSRPDGTYDVQPGVDVEPGFEPREVCVEVRAEPPADRNDLAPAAASGFTGVLRSQMDEPADVVEVDLTLPATDGG